MADEEPGIPFSAFVISLATTATVHFGDIAPPGSDEKPQPNPDAAKQMIDVLEMLERKTQGNLTPEERQLLTQVLFDLRMRYVEVKRALAGAGSAAPGAPSEGRTPAEPPAPEERRIIEP